MSGNKTQIFSSLTQHDPIMEVLKICERNLILQLWMPCQKYKIVTLENEDFTHVSNYLSSASLKILNR